MLARLEDEWSDAIGDALTYLSTEAPGIFAWPLAIFLLLVCYVLALAYLILKLFIPRKYK